MSDNFLISLRDDPKGTGIPGTGIGLTSAYMDIPPEATTYNLKSSIPPDQWRHRLRATTEKVLVFVHGFGDNADKVLDRHKSIKLHLAPDVTLVSFDWPAGNLGTPKVAYDKDKANAKTIAPRLLTDCLQLLLYGFDAKNIHLFAHSMGAYVTETAFQLGGEISINHVLMAAADVDRGYYVDGSVFLANFLGKCADLTVYWSTEDAALQESATFNNYVPLGLRGYPDPDLPKKHSVQCTDYYNVYVKPVNKTVEFSHVWYLLFQPTIPPPLANDFYTDMNEILQGSSTLPTRGLHYMLKTKAQLGG